MRGTILTHEVAGARARTWLEKLTATQLLVLSFMGLVAVGTAGLLWLPGLYTGPDLGFVDSLFTSTSAVCVTGLIVVDTATYFTFWGQLWILLLIQAGGLGILTFTTLALTALGRRGSLRLKEASGSDVTYLRHIESDGLVRTVVTVTFAVEAVGATLLWLLWRGSFGAVDALWHAVFQSVSAFCNAGFSTFSDSLVGFQDQVGVLYVIGALIVCGGLGFVVLEDLRVRFLDRDTRRLSVHTRLVLATTAFLIVVAWGAFLAFEWTGELGHMGLWDKIANAGFMSVTPRTAGFNSVDYARLSNASVFLTIILMVIGGSPGSTAGGLKTVVAALLFLLLAARLRGQEDVHVFNRTVPRDTIQRAMGLVIGGPHRPGRRGVHAHGHGGGRHGRGRPGRVRHAGVRGPQRVRHGGPLPGRHPRPVRPGAPHHHRPHVPGAGGAHGGGGLHGRGGGAPALRLPLRPRGRDGGMRAPDLLSKGARA